MSDTVPSKKYCLPGPVNVVGSLVQPTLSPADWARVPTECEVVEFRLDAFPQSMAAVRLAIAMNPCATLVTARDPREGGLNAIGLTPRHALLLSVLEEAELIDVEIANLGVFSDLVEQAHEAGALVVGSFHDFQGIPPVEVLDDLIAEAQSLGADIVKFAVTPACPAELASLAALIASHPGVPLSLMGMGRLGRVSRLLLGQLGSVLNYGYLDGPTVAGQWPAGELKHLITRLRE